ncbi:hypothetical protein SAMN05421504_110143 [Amycolatopsis xylanica]|uniref:Repetin n=1 Tax=Amycolatopsis xylanica TaxID=589385 RepID=A0A1H3QWS7_9PSEU|nr:hypothetical protein [Amycolatopsis xylanica]SDZ18052.1 hypothetical protein SAMN05421504_110143 [Amycolatopsis xylanica]
MYRKQAAAVGVALVLAATGTASAVETAGKPTEPSLAGHAKMYRPAGDDVQFTFDAHGFATDARGTFRVYHAFGGESGWFEGTVDCLLVGGPVAVLTGVVTATNVPGLQGVRRGMTVYDHGRRDRVGYSWALDTTGTESVPKCLSSAPFETVESGDFKVVEWLPPTRTS